MTISRRIIIGEYMRIRNSGMTFPEPVIVIISKRLGYKINQNGDNTFVRKVLRDFLDHYNSIDAEGEEPLMLAQEITLMS